METLKTSNVLADKEHKHDDLAERFLNLLGMFSNVVDVDVNSPHDINNGPKPIVYNCRYC